MAKRAGKWKKWPKQPQEVGIINLKKIWIWDFQCSVPLLSYKNTLQFHHHSIIYKYISFDQCFFLYVCLKCDVLSL